MAELVCEICGGKLVGKPGGIFECDSCGVQYSTEWAKAKIQEIRGTVKIDGTVNVTGEVQVTGSATKDSLLKRAKMCFEDGDTEKAQELLDRVLNADPECGEAYLYQCALKENCKTISQLHGLFVDIYEPRVWESPEMQKALRFSEAGCKELLDSWTQERDRTIAADMAHRNEMINKLEAKRKRIASIQNFISVSKRHAVGLRQDGTVVATGCNDHGQCDISKWMGIKSVIAVGDTTYGLKFDGTVIVAGGNWNTPYNAIKKWKDIIELAIDGDSVIGLRKDGTVVSTGYNSHGQCNVSGWNDIVQISTRGYHTVGLKRNGTVIATGSNIVNECQVSDWKNIVAISAGYSITVGICADGTTKVASKYENTILDGVRKWKNAEKVNAVSEWNIAGLWKDGTVISTGLPECKINTNTWRDIVDVFPNDHYVAGLKLDGTIEMTGQQDVGQASISNWKNVVMVVGNSDMLVGLLENGTVVSAGTHKGEAWSPKEGKKVPYTFDFSGWKLFDDLDTVEEKRKAARDSAIEIYEQQERIRMQQKSELEREKQTLATELSNVKGLFAGMKRKDIEGKINRVEKQLSELE